MTTADLEKTKQVDAEKPNRRKETTSDSYSTVRNLQVTPISHSDAKRLLVSKHYLHSFPGGTKLNFGIFYQSFLMGAITLGVGPFLAYGLVDGATPEDCITLTRLWLADDLPHNSESHVIGILLRSLQGETTLKLVVGFLLLLMLPVNFKYPLFAAVIFLDGVSMGMFIAPNTAAIMNSLPPQHRGAGSGMRATIMNVGTPLSTAIIFSLMVVGLNASMPAALYSGLVQNGIPTQIAHQVASAPSVGYLFAAFLGYNPLKTLIPANVLNTLSAQQAANITSRAFFPQLIDTAFHRGLVEVLIFSIIMCLIGAVASWVRGGKYVYHENIES
jgi:hypothetical protein